jgi:hypothetical protein
MHISINRALRSFTTIFPSNNRFAFSHPLHRVDPLLTLTPASGGPTAFFILDVHVVVMANYSRELPKRRSNRHE